MDKQVEQIKAEIERWKKELRLSTSCEAKYRREMLDDISEFIDTLQEEPVSEDLEEEIQRAYHDRNLYDDSIDHNTFDNIAHHFVNWQKEKMMKDAVDADTVYMIGEGTLFNPEVLPDNIKPGDKVKLIIVKEEENESN